MFPRITQRHLPGFFRTVGTAAGLSNPSSLISNPVFFRALSTRAGSATQGVVISQISEIGDLLKEAHEESGGACRLTATHLRFRRKDLVLLGENHFASLQRGTHKLRDTSTQT